jgi:serine/threonine-protein kinase
MNQHPAYELFEELGRGSNTVVYRSYDLSLGREVAIKELDENSRRDTRQREQFLREAQFLAQFEHDNVLRVYSVDPERGWIIMELMKGTLASLIAAGPSDPDLVRSILKQTLDALAFLHEKDKVHGTVRPTNLLINDAGRVKLSEFEQTNVGGELRAPKGSKKYLAPELIRPEFGDFGPPLDLYCLAFTALELLKGPQFDSIFPGTGKGAIDADMAWLRWHSSADDLAPTAKLVKNIPADLAHVLDRMLKKRVADRPQSAQEVLKELEDRPLIAVPVAGVETTEGGSPEDRHLAPAVVRTLATPQAFSPRGSSPDAGLSNTSTTRTGTTAKAARAGKSSGPAKPAAKPYSKEWFNEQLGRPYVLYPLCAVILLGALWYSLGSMFSSPEPAAAKADKQAPKPAAPSFVAVKFDIQPDAKDVEVVDGTSKISPASDGKFPLFPGRHKVTFRKDGFEPLTSEFDVSVEHNAFPVKLEPAIKFADVTINVTPANAQVKIDNTPLGLTNGAATQKVQVGKALAIDARLDGYQTITRSISADELTKLGNKVAINLEREKPRLPDSLVAKPGAPLDAETQLPVRVLATRLRDSEAMEFALVKAGTYSYGSSETKRRPNEVARRSVRIDQPFYIATTETTNAQFNRFFETEGESKAGSRWQTASRKWAKPMNLDPIKNRLPVTNVSPEQAQAFCTWIGGKLPTEIEWECAVRGPQDKGYPYPWGSGEPDREHCRIFNGERLERGEGGPVPVDQLAAGASPIGLMHAIGNAAEWCLDSEERGGFILRGCSIATANIDDVRVTSRGRGDVRGEEFTGFRVIVPVALKPATTTTATASVATNSTGAASTGSVSLATPIGFFGAIPWKSVIGAVGSIRDHQQTAADILATP